MALHKAGTHWLYKNINTWFAQNLGFPKRNRQYSLKPFLSATHTLFRSFPTQFCNHCSLIWTRIPFFPSLYFSLSLFVSLSLSPFLSVRLTVSSSLFPPPPPSLSSSLSLVDFIAVLATRSVVVGAELANPATGLHHHVLWNRHHDAEEVWVLERLWREHTQVSKTPRLCGMKRTEHAREMSDAWMYVGSMEGNCWGCLTYQPLETRMTPTPSVVVGKCPHPYYYLDYIPSICNTAVKVSLTI